MRRALRRSAFAERSPRFLLIARPVDRWKDLIGERIESVHFESCDFSFALLHGVLMFSESTFGCFEKSEFTLSTKLLKARGLEKRLALLSKRLALLKG